MNTQNTPVHIHLWHRDFWLMAVANMLLAMSVYMLIPVLPVWMMTTQQLSFWQTGLAMGVYGVGLFLPGMFVSFLVQHYRRNLACIGAILLLAASLGLLYYTERLSLEFPALFTLRVLTGIFFGVAQMILTSTLIIDTCESFQRTEANHSASWFSRFALSLGPLSGLLVERLMGFGTVLLVSISAALLSAMLILLVHFPFRTPEDNTPTISLDRFFLSQGWLLFINLLLVMVVAGMLMSTGLSELFYAMMMVGFLLALLAQRFVFHDAELKSEVVSGLILLIAALLMMLMRQQIVVVYASPLFVGFSLGIIGSRFLLFFIKLSRHCQRGTSQSTYLLGWEGGLAFGLGIGYGFMDGESNAVLKSALILSVIALLLYNLVTHRWFLCHKNR